MRLNLNADLGESWGRFRIGDDEAMLDIVQSANVACGMHGSDPQVMARTIAAARARGVSVGAHPGYADLQGFGRREMHLPEQELSALVTWQLGALSAVARAAGVAMTHVKPHGAMNNLACTDAETAGIIARAVAGFDPGLILLAPVLSELAVAGEKAGLRIALEIFADRTYAEDGQLAPRGTEGAVLHDPGEMRDHVRRMIDAGGIVTRGGAVLSTPFHSICLHGDGATAVAGARAVSDGLRADGHELVTLPVLWPVA